MTTHNYQDLMVIFDQCFYDEFNTRLIKGDDEPVYLPADQHSDFHRIVFAHGFFASALHEISHWCVAGEARRKLVDFGYWYCPDGRDQQTQQQFEAVEVTPQAFEWMFSVAAGFPFNVSCDNLEETVNLTGSHFSVKFIRKFRISWRGEFPGAPYGLLQH